MRSLVAALAAALLLSGCSGWFGEAEEEALEGERIDIAPRVRVPAPSTQVAGLAVTLPPRRTNADWLHEGGDAAHAMQHVAAPDRFDAVWRSDAGTGSGSDTRILGQPVIAASRVYTIDSGANVSAFDAGDGSLLWRAGLVGEDDDDDGILGGGLAADGGRIFATTGFSHVVALDAADGTEIWRHPLNAPIRAAPTVRDGRVFVVTIADELFALDAEDGRELWFESGLSEVARLVGAAPPAVHSGVVVVPSSSGEIVALRAENGRRVWSESLAGLRPADTVSALPHIRGWPVIDRGIVFATSHGNRTMAVNLRTGELLWVSPVGGVNGPWSAGDFVYVMTGEAALVCLTRRGGLVRWVRQLRHYEDEEDQEDEIFWSGPVLAGDRLVVANSLGEIVSLSPADGSEVGRTQAPGRILIAPAVALETLFVLTESADLVAFR